MFLCLCECNSWHEAATFFGSFLVDKYHLISQHENCFQTEFLIAGCKEILKVGSEQFHDHKIASILGAEPLHSGEPNVLAHDFYDLVFVNEL